MTSATAPWQAPMRDAAFHELAAHCRARGLLLWSAMSFGEAKRMGGAYWVAPRHSSRYEAVKGADSLAELRTWLRIPEPAEVQQ